MILSTTEYGIFKKHPSNREVREDAVLKLQKSIKQKNLLHKRPILVNKEMEVLEGQHRLEAARRLDIPVFYQIDEEASVDDILHLNIHKSWTREDYLNYFCSIGMEHYVNLRRFMKENNLNLSGAFSVMGVKRGNGNGRGASLLSRFKDGHFVFPNAETQIKLKYMLEQIQTVKDFLNRKMIGHKKYTQGPKFTRCLREFLLIPGVDFETFLKKLDMKLDLIRPTLSFHDSDRMFRAIYNFNNRNPLPDSN